MWHKQLWPALCSLSDILEEQGLTSDERQKRAVDLFSAMPPTVQRRVMDCTLRLSRELPDLYAAIIAAANQSEECKDKELCQDEGLWKDADTA
jgi:hypothetical protein